MAKNNPQAAALLEDLKTRGIFNNITSEAKFLALAPHSAVYIGFDPTAKSLHLGNFIQITLLKRFLAYGFSPIAVLGGATGMIGDPSLRSTERAVLPPQVLNANKRAIKKQLETFGLTVVDNYSWYQKMSFLRFLRDVGRQINVNYMIAKDSVKARLEAGLSFTEFSYQLIQGWDFKHLYETRDVMVQLGGSDQWGNITTGIELIRKAHGEAHQAIGLTVELLTTSDGQKYGKSAGNALWLDKTLTSPFALYQFLLATSDRDVAKLLGWLSMQSNEQLAVLIKAHQAAPSRQLAQQAFANEMVQTIHGQAALEEVATLTKALYDNTLTFPLSKAVIKTLKAGLANHESLTGLLIDALVTTNLASSKREAREFIQSGAIVVDGQKISDVTFTLTKEKAGQAHLIRKGKRAFCLITY